MNGTRVCFVSPYAHAFFSGDPSGFGGAEVQQIWVGRALAARGFDVRFISYAPGPGREETHDGIRFHTLPLSSRGGEALPGASIGSFWRALSRANADVYYQRCAGSLTGTVGLYARLHRRAFIFSVANDRDLDGHFLKTSRVHQAALYRLGLRLASAIVVQSDTQARLLRERWGREGVLISSACPIPEGPLPPAARRQGALWVGNLLPKKRPALLTELAAALPEIPFTMIAPATGDPAFVTAVRDRVRACPNIRHVPRVPYAGMLAYYRDAALLLSTSSAEGFPNVFLEAWANRMPVVSLEIDPDELLCGKGLGVHAKTLDEMLAAVRRLVADPAEREAIGERAQAYVRDRHAPEAVGERYEALIAAILKC
jgi:glycosyltransferase involved in cell wall biosynthesis